MHYEKILPEYPRTPHLFYRPNAVRSDLIASEKDCQIIFETDDVYVSEKIDGAQVGINYFEGYPVIRNRNNFLKKGKIGHLRTAAKMQFAPIFNWFYENVNKFEKLNKLCGFNASVYAEWMVATHSCRYDQLPCYFMAYDVYDWERSHFMQTGKALKLLSESGFETPPLLHQGKVPSYAYLEKFMEEMSPFSTLDKREGVYIKVCDNDKVISRFKWVRSDFIQGGRWDSRKISKNEVAK